MACKQHCIRVANITIMLMRKGLAPYRERYARLLYQEGDMPRRGMG